MSEKRKKIENDFKKLSKKEKERLAKPITALDGPGAFTGLGQTPYKADGEKFKKELEKRGGKMVKTKDRIPRDTKVRFRYMDDFTGETAEKIGFTKGLPKDIRIRWPEEYAELPDDAHCYLILPEVHDPNMRSPFYVVWEEDILEVLKKAK